MKLEMNGKKRERIALTWQREKEVVKKRETRRDRVRMSGMISEREREKVVWVSMCVFCVWER